MSDASGDKTTGRTPWDVAAIVLSCVGPTTIVVAGFLVFTYFLYTEINRARETANKQLAESLSLAQNQLVENTRKLGDMSATLITNITNMLELNEEANKKINAAWAEVVEANRELVRKEEALKLALQAIDKERRITAISVVPGMFDRRNELMKKIDGLAAAKAKALVTKIGDEFPAGGKPFIEAQYPDTTRTFDVTGSKAKTLLKRVVTLTVRNPEDAAKWQAAIDSF